MSRVVDERIVSMEFDNKNFERNVQESRNSIKALEKDLKLKGAAEGIQNVNKASNNAQVDFSKLEATACSSAFRIKDVWIKLANVFEYHIARKIKDSLINTFSSLTITPIKSGLSEYETQLGAIQTILANTQSKGSTLEDVNKALDELNRYADKTIYNFTEMTKNIGTFTAAGVDLDSSVSAIKGIANLAAISGSTSQQASTAMYQLSQALATGTVRLMDWNSVVNAGMGGQVFQDALKETARVHGVAIDQIIKDQGSFRESLSEGWLTSEILTETLSVFTGDLTEQQLVSMGYTTKQAEEMIKLGQTANAAATEVKTFTQLMSTLQESAQSGWAQTWEIIIGDFNEAKKLWTNISNSVGGVIQEMSDARNKLLSDTLDSGWEKLLGRGIMDETGYTNWIKNIAGKKKINIEGMIAEETALWEARAEEEGVSVDKLISKEEIFQNVLKKGLKEGTITTEIFSEALNGLANQYDPEKMSEQQLAAMGYTEDQRQALLKLNEEFQNGSISMEEYLKMMKKMSGRELLFDSFKNIGKYIKKIIDPITKAWTAIFPSKNKAAILYDILEAFNNFTSKLSISESTADKLQRTFKGLFAVMDIVKTVTKAILEITFKLLGLSGGLIDNILTVTAFIGDFLVYLKDCIKGSETLTGLKDGIVGFFTFIANHMKKLWEQFKELDFSWIIDGFMFVCDVLKAVWKFVKGIFTDIITGFKNTFNGNGFTLKDIFTTIATGGIAALIIKITQLIKDFKNTKKQFFGTIREFAEEFKESLIGLEEQALKVELFKSIALALAIFVGSILLLTLIDKEKLDTAISTMIIVVTLLMSMLTMISKIKLSSVNDIKGLALSIVPIAIALGIVAKALVTMGSLDEDSMKVAITGLVGSLITLVGGLASIKKINGNGVSVKDIVTLIATSLAMVVLAGVMKIIASMEWEEIWRGLTGISLALVALTGALSIMKIGGTRSVKDIFNMITISLSLLILAGVMAIIGSMKWEQIWRGLTGMSLALAAFTLSLSLLKLGKNSIGIAVNFMALAASLLLVVLVLKQFANMDFNKMESAISQLTDVLLIMVVTIGLLTVISAMAGAGNLLAAAASIAIMSVSLIAMAAALAILAAIGPLAIAVNLVVLAAGVVVFGAACALFSSCTPVILAIASALLMLSVSVLITGVGVLLLATGFSILVTTILAGGSVLLDFLESAIKLLPLFGEKVGEALIVFSKVIINGAGVIATAIATVISEVLKSLVVLLPEISDSILQLIIGLLDSLVQYAPTIVGRIVELIIGLLKAIADYIPSIIGTLVDLVMAVFEGFKEAVQNINPETLLEGLKSIGLIAAILAALGLITALVPGAILGILALATVVAEVGLLLAGFGAVADKFPKLEGLISKGGNLLQAIGTALGQFIGGIVGGIAQGISSALPTIGSNLSAFMTNVQPFINGISTLDSSMLDNAKTLVGVILAITGASLLNSITSFLDMFTGQSSMAKFGSELALFGVGIRAFSASVTGINCQAVTAAANAGKTLAEMANLIPSEGGLWQLFSGDKKLDKFGEELPKFGNGIKAFSDKVRGIDCSAVTAAANAGKTLAEMAKLIPNEGGLIAIFAGDNSMGSFATQLPEFGKGIKAFAESVTGLNYEDITKGVSAAESLARMAKTLPNQGGLLAVFAGDNAIGQFGTQLPAFADGIKDFAGKMADLSLEDVTKGVAAASQLSEMAKMLPNDGGLIEIFTGNNSMDLFGTKLVSFGESIKEFADIMSTVTLDVAANKLSSLNNSFKSLATSGITAFTDAITDSKDLVSGSIMDTIKYAIDAADEKVKDFVDVAKKLMIDFIDSIELYELRVKNAFVSVINASISTITSPRTIRKFYDAGKNIAQGLANGIDKNTYLVTAKAKAMANAAKEAAKEALDENSPSKEFEDIGEYAGEGLVNGLDKWVKYVYNSGSNLGETAKNGLNSVINTLCDVLENGVDTQPTITPVLNLDEFSAGVNAMNGMLNMSPSVGVLSRANSINHSMNKNQNGGNDDVVSAIKDLGNALENASGDTYNIGVNADGSAELEAAIKTIVRAAVTERRR